MDDIRKLLAILPVYVTELIDNPNDLMEIVLDLGRPLLLRYKTYKTKFEDVLITQHMLDNALENVGVFGPDNRAGLNCTLHRISRCVNRTGETIGLTCRVGRPYFGSVKLFEDLVRTGMSILLIGIPGAGKSSKVRDAARFLADECDRSVVIVDGSNELAGDGAVPHEAVGDSRRLMVPPNKTQHEVMIEAVENMAPEVIVVDELSTIEEAEAARTISQRGVQLIATAHGRTLEHIMKNPPLMSLIGGINSVTISDRKAEEDGTSKTILEREMEPTFDIVIELVGFNEIRVYPDVKMAVDAYLLGLNYKAERRVLVDGNVIIAEKFSVETPRLTTDYYEEEESVKRVHRTPPARRQPQKFQNKDERRNRSPRRGR